MEYAPTLSRYQRTQTQLIVTVANKSIFPAKTWVRNLCSQTKICNLDAEIATPDLLGQFTKLAY